MPGVNSVIGFPIEFERVAVDPQQIDPWFDELAEKVQRIPRAFVFHVDKTGCSEHADSREVRALMPIDCHGTSIPVPLDRNSKRSTFTVCIVTDGFRAKSFMIVA
jgi:hypothetical protein